MWRILSVMVVVCVVCLFSVKAQTLNELESSIILNDKSADVYLVIDNPNKISSAKINLELLDEKDSQTSQTSINQILTQGKETYKITLPFGDLLEKNQSDITWYRLRYQVGDSRGIISLSQILKDNFEIQVIASNNLLAGMTYRTRIRAFNPFNFSAVAGVKVTADLELEIKDKDDKKLNLTANGETDNEGFVNLDFQIPVETNLDDGKISVIGKKNGIIRETDDDLSALSDDFLFPMMTDKPIYQPEQTLNVRGILLKGGSKSKVVLPNSEVEFRVEDEDNTVLYRQKSVTSEFGVASMSWQIPESAKLGQYRIRVKKLDTEGNDYIAYQSIKVSRYDLPNFVVNAKSLKAYYLPNENEAEIEVNADYLFGKPVTNGKVRIVRETERSWNYKEQKYDISEGDLQEGKTDENGKYKAKFDLTKDQEDLKDEDYDKFDDLHFTAYFTDLTTNRTEQRRFDVRVTKEPIHVYFIGDRDNKHANLPVNAYVSAFYADGSPCQCEIELKGREEDSDDIFKTILKTKTNSLGGGKLNFYRPKFEDADLDDDLEIQIVAKDKNGLQGTFGTDENNWRNEINFDDKGKIQLSTNKTIFKPGEVIKININTAFESDTENKSPKIYIDIVRDWSVIDSFFVTLKNGKAELKLPYQPKYQGEIQISAYFEDEDDDLIHTAKGIIFPFSENLKVDARFDKTTYKPAEEATTSFSILNSIGKAVESALGIVVFDKAVEERARTEGDFNGAFKNYYGWLGYGGSFGGINIKDINELNLTKSISDEYQLAAEIILEDQNYYPNVFRSNKTPKYAQSVYTNFFRKQFDPIEKKLAEHFKNRQFEHPIDDASLRKILNENGINFDSLLDPWEQKYRTVFSISRENDVLVIISAGADKKFDTADDFAVSSSNFLYFTPTANRITDAASNFYIRTGKFIRDEQTLFQELGISELKDRFGNPYQITFGISGRNFAILIISFGRDGKEYQSGLAYDDFTIYNRQQDYFKDTESKIWQIFQNLKSVPNNETEFASALKQNDLDLNEIRDGWGEKIYIVKNQYSRYENRVTQEVISEYGKESKTTKTIITPVTREYISFKLRSKGGDKIENTSDDFTLAEFARFISEQTKDDPKPVYKPTSFSKNDAGSISGTVADSQGAIIAGATVTATNNETSQSKSSITNDSGKYIIGNLETGNYNVRVIAAGFKSSVRSNIPITGNNLIVDFQMEVGTVSEAVTVEVSSGAETVNASSSTLITEKRIAALPKGIDASQLLKLQPGIVAETENDDSSTSSKSTPRLRQYFPETLYWSPELKTDKDGKATINFKMADNITTWKLYAIASNKTGKIGIAEKEITVFQPFFVDLDPPKFLTEGDEIFLPVQVRNYTTGKQKVDVTMAKSDWFSFLDSEKKQIEVDKNAAGNAVFGFKTITPVKAGLQRVTAIAIKDSDAIEKPVTVRPNGEEIIKTETELFTNSAQFEINFPSNTLPKTQKAELKIYPNLLSHVTESVEGLLQRPYGCGEQTISSTYPNLMILKYIKDESSLKRKAKKYLQSGYERLLGYQVTDGGFSYWGGKDASNLALTAYALRFLTDAQDFIEVDEKVIERAKQYLISQQRADGSWYKKYYAEEKEDSGRAKMTTTYIARTLAKLNTDKSSLEKGLAYLKNRNSEIDEPYSLALYALTNFDVKQNDEAEKTVSKLITLGKSEGNSVYWNLESNTPFYGWGTAGRIETTALVIQSLLKSKNQNQQTKDLISKGMLFLLKNKDRYGVWYSTQTTINVLDTFLATLSESKSQTISVSLNGEKLKDFNIPADRIEPIILPLKDNLTSANSLEIKSSEKSAVMAQIVQNHYIDWKDSTGTNRNVNDSRAIRLDYKCDKLTPKIMETVTCAVEAERIGFQGYGMLLAEIGIPPGADVSRESLEKAFENDWSLSRYDILPDRIVVYMWAKAGGSKFNFSFKPRYGINAKTPASIVYDYYNEESRGLVAPLKFEVK